MRTSYLTPSDHEFLKALKIAPSERAVRSSTPAGAATSAATPAPFYVENRDELWNSYMDALGQRNEARESSKRWRRKALLGHGLFLGAVALMFWGWLIPAVLDWMAK